MAVQPHNSRKDKFYEKNQGISEWKRIKEAEEDMVCLGCFWLGVVRTLDTERERVGSEVVMYF